MENPTKETTLFLEILMDITKYFPVFQYSAPFCEYTNYSKCKNCSVNRYWYFKFQLLEVFFSYKCSNSSYSKFRNVLQFMSTRKVLLRYRVILL
jgi:hypothetical protein